MPELPEVETLRRQLNRAVKTKQISDVKILRSKSFQGDYRLILGQKIKHINRTAKILIVRFTRTFPQVLIHLKMTGQLIYQPYGKIKSQLVNGRVVGGHPTLDWVGALPSRHTRTIIEFSDRSQLFFNDMRVFGWLKVITSPQTLQAEFASLSSVEPLSSQFTISSLAQILNHSRRAVKIIIMDQKFLAGVGNIYANDALFMAKIDPLTPANKLSHKQVAALHAGLNHVIDLGIRQGGASDSTYRHLSGLGGKYQLNFLTYKRDGQPCYNCGTKLLKVKLGGRGTYYCPICQK